ncbi:MAG: hypothetical protein H0U82_02560, partial [Actinobacteria bacterium]|nr:hypothetical protein [Actinomycetota bacterium]
LNRAYAVAQPGQTVQVAGGTYPTQNIDWRPGRDQASAVVFRPAGRVTIDGHLKVWASGVHIAGKATGTVTDWRSRTYSIRVTGDTAVLGDSASQHPRNVTLEGVDTGSLGTYTAETVLVRDIDAGPVVQGAACNRPQPVIGANVDAELFNPRNVTWERVVLHGFDRDQAAAEADCHTGGLFIVNGSNITIRESVFAENIVYNIQVQNYFGRPARNVLIENSWFGCPVLAGNEAATKTCNGQASLQFNAQSAFSDWLVRFNSFASLYAAGGEGSYSNIRFVGNAGRAPGSNVCRGTGVSFRKNAWAAGTCSASDILLTSLPFVNSSPGQEDLKLRPKTRAAGLVVGSDPDFRIASDIEHRMRPVRAGRDAGAAQIESAEIVPGGAIGTVRLKVSRQKMIAFYGRPRRSSIRSGIRSDRYRAHGGTLWLRYRGSHVVAVGTTSGYYTTRGGIGPGSSVRDAQRLLGVSWDACRGLYRRAVGGGVLYIKTNRARRAVVTVSNVARSAEEPCSPER